VAGGYRNIVNAPKLTDSRTAHYRLITNTVPVANRWQSAAHRPDMGI